MFKTNVRLIDMYQSRLVSILRSHSREDSVVLDHDAALVVCDSTPNHGEFEIRTAVKQSSTYIHLLLR